MEPKLPEQLRLVPRKSFDPRVFIDSNAQTQKVCDFVLALALAFNDLNDFMTLHYFLKECRPKDSVIFESEKWGYFCGADLHIFRRKVAMMLEIQSLLSKSSEAKHPAFKGLIGKLQSKDPDFRWDEILNPPPALSSFFENIRHKLANHYYFGSRQTEHVVLGEGYRQQFGDGKVPFISYGRNSLDTRLYFADAAVQGVLELKDWRAMEPKIDKYLAHLCYCLTAIVVVFIESRDENFRITNESAT